MRPIRLPEPPSGSIGMPDIFEGGVNVIRRAVVIGNGFAGSENQSIGLVRALGLSEKQTIYVRDFPSLPLPVSGVYLIYLVLLTKIYVVELKS